jgi:hypothetical protein
VSSYAAAGAITASHSAHLVNAMRSTGPVVQVDSHAFATLLSRNREALVVYAAGGAIRQHKYLMGYKGLFFATKTRAPIQLPQWVDVVTVRRLHLPY